MSSEIDDRRQRALESAYDNADSFNAQGDWQRAIETATQVKLTEDILTAGVQHLPGLWRNEVQELAKALFTAAGFEVIE